MGDGKRLCQSVVTNLWLPKVLSSLCAGGRDDSKDDPDFRHDDHPIVDRRENEWRHPSHTFFLATFAPERTIPNRWLSVHVHVGPSSILKEAVG
jgi:hypothetical protein